MTFRHLLFAVFFSMILLMGCTPAPHPQGNQDFLHETWMQTINLNPMLWTRDADRWFFTGEPNTTEQDARKAKSNKAISTISVKVSQFTRIDIHGCFQVQLVGGQPRNSVTILGPNEETRQTVVESWGDTLVVTETDDPKTGMPNLKNVIVRIGVGDLRHLKVSGAVKVEGRMLASRDLSIQANNQGTILLSGNVNLTAVDNRGPGAVSVLGACTPCLDVINRGSGTVNVSGRVGIRAISNLTSGKVHIIGADTRSLKINACNDSRTSVAGYANLKHLNATGNACVHLYWMNSDGASIFMNGNARVGLAGCVSNLDVYAAGNARFGGQYLHAGNAYVQTHNNAHVNVSASRRLFASATDTSSIYYFGQSANVSRYSKGQASVIPVWGGTTLPVPSRLPQFMTTVNAPVVVHPYRG